MAKQHCTASARGTAHGSAVLPGRLVTCLRNTAPAEWYSTFPSINKGTAANLMDTTYDNLRYCLLCRHGELKINWGPSSRHDRVVVTGFADAHAEAISDIVDGSVYVRLVTRAGREVASADQ